MTVKQQQTIKHYRKNATIILLGSTAGKWELSDVLVRRVYLEQVSKVAGRGNLAQIPTGVRFESSL